MELNLENRQIVDYFIGKEVESTIMKNEITLFVVGIKDPDEVMSLVEKHNIKHVFVGASQSFKPKTNSDWDGWDNLISILLKNDLWVTVDFDVKYAADVLEYDWNDGQKFIPMISIKILNIKDFNYFTTLKIDDDTTSGYSNPGIWCHPLNELMTTSRFTSWKDYTGDKMVSPE